MRAAENCGMSEMVERLPSTRRAVQCGTQAADVDKGRGLGGDDRFRVVISCAECSPRATQDLRKAHEAQKADKEDEDGDEDEEKEEEEQTGGHTRL